MPETRSEVILRQIANAIRKETGDNHYRAPTEMSSNSIRDMIWVSCTRPICQKILFHLVCVFGTYSNFIDLLLTEPICMGASVSSLFVVTQTSISDLDILVVDWLRLGSILLHDPVRQLLFSRLIS